MTIVCTSLAARLNLYEDNVSATCLIITHVTLPCIQDTLLHKVTFS